MRRALFIGCAVLAMAGFAYTQYLVFYGTPIDRLLMFNQKIFYYHVPCWFMLFASVFACGIASFRYLRTRQGRHDDVAVAAGELAVLFGALGLVTGSIWAKAAWSVWWVWDARLVMSLLLWLTMLGYVLVRKYGGPGLERLGAGVALFACVSVPFVYFSVRLWRTLHPESSVVPSLEGSMRGAFWLSVLLFGIVWSLLLVTRIAIARTERQLNEAREIGLDAGLFE
jgi:heme exporter protein C